MSQNDNSSMINIVQIETAVWNGKISRKFWIPLTGLQLINSLTFTNKLGGVYRSLASLMTRLANTNRIDNHRQIATKEVWMQRIASNFGQNLHNTSRKNTEYYENFDIESKRFEYSALGLFTCFNSSMKQTTTTKQKKTHPCEDKNCGSNSSSDSV